MMVSDTAFARCTTKIPRTRTDAITEAMRLGYPVSPYICPNGKDHWHVGRSKRNGGLFHRHRARWEAQTHNQEQA